MITEAISRYPPRNNPFFLIHFVCYQLCLMSNLVIPHKHNTGTTIILYIYFLVLYLSILFMIPNICWNLRNLLSQSLTYLRDAPNPKWLTFTTRSIILYFVINICHIWCLPLKTITSFLFFVSLNSRQVFFQLLMNYLCIPASRIRQRKANPVPGDIIGPLCHWGTQIEGPDSPGWEFDASLTTLLCKGIILAKLEEVKADQIWQIAQKVLFSRWWRQWNYLNSLSIKLGGQQL